MGEILKAEDKFVLQGLVCVSVMLTKVSRSLSALNVTESL